LNYRKAGRRRFEDKMPRISVNIRGDSHYIEIDAPDGFGAVMRGYLLPPATGSYTVRLRDSADDSDVATLAVTVV
jgi:hypothetical protein